jgi:ABC-type nitrate/sulfonate/bicarbonate transport system substrate-binding protein
MRLRPTAALVLASLMVLAACGSDNPSTDDTAPDVDSDGDSDGNSDGNSDVVSDVVAGEAFPDDRCAANQAAGTITYLTGFDFAATASIVDVIVADANGYYDDLCLDVDIVPSFSTANYPLVAENDAQFASGGSFSEVVAFADANDTDFVVTAVEGPTAIDSLIVKPGIATQLADLAGTTIGVKGKLPPSVAAMLATAGLVENQDYTTVLLDGFDPTAHIAIDAIDGFPGYKSNEPGALERAGITFDLFDPLDSDIPGSFGVIYTNQQFIADHPSAAEDFMRATMRGLADAIADPDTAATTAVGLINSGGNPNFLSPEGEVFRWNTDAALITELTPNGVGYGTPDPDALQNELDTYAAVGLFATTNTPDTTPIATDYLSDILAGIYDTDTTIIWPAV